MKKTIFILTLLFYQALNICSQDVQNIFFSNVGCKKEINKDHIFFYKVNDSIEINKIVFHKFILGKGCDSIVGYWGYHSDTIFFSPQETTKDECTHIFPYFILNTENEKYSQFSINFCGENTVRIGLIRTSFISESIKDGVKVYRYRQVFEGPCPINQYIISETLEDVEQGLSVREFGISFSNGIVEFSQILSKDPCHKFIW